MSKEKTDLEFIHEVFPDLDKLSETDKLLEIKKIKERFTKNIEKTKNGIFGWKMFAFGIIAGIVANLWANILSDFLKKFNLIYVVFLLLILTLFIIRKMINSFINYIDTEMSEDLSTKKFWDYVKTKNN